MPHKARRSYFAIRAWNVELASIKDGGTRTISDGAEGRASVALQVRIQWWKEALSQIYGLGRYENNQNHSKIDASSVLDTLASSYFKNPIVRVLDYAVYEKQLTRRFLERLLEAREADLHSQQPETVDDMIEYADNIHSSLLYLALETVGVRDESVDVVAQHAGIGIGLVTALRGARIRLNRGECFVPKDLLPQDFPYYKLLHTNSISLKKDERAEETTNCERNQLDADEKKILKDAIEKICKLAGLHLLKARELQGDVPSHARASFLPIIPALHHLSKIEKAKYDIFDEALLENDNLTILLKVGRSWLTGVF